MPRASNVALLGMIPKREPIRIIIEDTVNLKEKVLKTIEAEVSKETYELVDAVFDVTFGWWQNAKEMDINTLNYMLELLSQSSFDEVNMQGNGKPTQQVKNC